MIWLSTVGGVRGDAPLLTDAEWAAFERYFQAVVETEDSDHPSTRHLPDRGCRTETDYDFASPSDVKS